MIYIMRDKLTGQKKNGNFRNARENLQKENGIGSHHHLLSFSLLFLSSLSLSPVPTPTELLLITE